MPPRASPPTPWLISPPTRAGWVALATGMGQWGAGASPRPRPPTPPPYSPVGVGCVGFIEYLLLRVNINLTVPDRYVHSW